MKVLNLKSYQKKNIFVFTKDGFKSRGEFLISLLFVPLCKVCMYARHVCGSVLTCISMQAPRGLASADEGESHCLHSLHKAATQSSLM